MKTRVTITLDSVVRQQAQLAAKRQGTTMSGLIETLLANQTVHKKSHVDAMLGIAREVDQPAPGTDPKYDYLKAKYLKSDSTEDLQEYKGS